MNPTRNGKIARLPHDLRENLNHRLRNGESGREIIAWLNALTEVQAILAAGFGRRPINDQNLTEWRQGGYRDWLDAREARSLAERLGRDALTGNTEGHPPLTEDLVCWVVANYVTASRGLAAIRGAKRWRLLRELCGDVTKLRLGDHTAQRLEIERTWMTARIAGVKKPRHIAIGRRTRPQSPRTRAVLARTASAVPAEGPAHLVSPNEASLREPSNPFKPIQTVPCAFQNVLGGIDRKPLEESIWARIDPARPR